MRFIRFSREDNGLDQTTDETVETNDEDEDDENKIPLVDMVYNRNKLESEGETEKFGFKLLNNEVTTRVKEAKAEGDTNEENTEENPDASEGDSDFGDTDENSSDEGSDSELDDDDGENEEFNSDDEPDDDSLDSSDADNAGADDEKKGDEDTAAESISFVNYSGEAGIGGKKLVNSEQQAFEQGLSNLGSKLTDVKNSWAVQKVGNGLKASGASAIGLLGLAVKNSYKSSKKLLRVGEETPHRFNKLMSAIIKLERNIDVLGKDFKSYEVNKPELLNKILSSGQGNLSVMLADQIELNKNLFNSTLAKLDVNDKQIKDIINFAIKGNIKIKANTLYEDPAFTNFSKSGSVLYEHDYGLDDYAYKKQLPGNKLLIGVFAAETESLEDYSANLAKSKMMLFPIKGDRMVSSIKIKDTNELKNMLRLMHVLCTSYIQSDKFYKSLSKGKKELSKNIGFRTKMLNIIQKEKRDTIKGLDALIQNKVVYFDRTFISACVTVQNNHYNFLSNCIKLIEGILRTS